MVYIVPDDVKALILAGGVGSRFHPYTEIIPKPMIPIGNTEKPVLEFIVRWLRKQGIGDFVFLVDYKWRYIYNYFEDGSKLGVRIRYSHDEQEGYRNTGGAVLKAYRERLVDSRGLIWYGDIIAAVDLNDLLRFHGDRGADLTLVVTRSYKVPVGVVDMGKDNRIMQMREKPELDISATIGVAVVEKYVFEEDIEKHLGKDFDFMGDLVPWLIERGYRVYGYIYTGQWYDVGSLERYKKISNTEFSALEEMIL